jgi:hypothetical protein
MWALGHIRDRLEFLLDVKAELMFTQPRTRISTLFARHRILGLLVYVDLSEVVP